MRHFDSSSADITPLGTPRPGPRTGSWAAAAALAALLGGLLGACAQTGPDTETQRMGAPGGINQSDTNLEDDDAPIKSGPPSAVQPEQ